jgi:hypothetical protein
MIATNPIKSSNIFVNNNTTVTTTCTGTSRNAAIHNKNKSDYNSHCTIHTKAASYQKQLYVLLLLVLLWCIYIYVQYQYYYSSATIAAVNRFIRHEALLLEQQQQLQLQQKTTIVQQKSIPSQRFKEPLQSSSHGMLRKISPQQLLLRSGTDRTTL